jgi:AraC-like DNA-binding protein
VRVVAPEPVSPGVAAALAFIDANYAERITLADAARVAAYSRWYFSKAFKQQVGVGFCGYITDLRLRIAQQLLNSSDLRVTDIALMAGFGDVCQFERIFRRARRQTPTQYRASTAAAYHQRAA